MEACTTECHLPSNQCGHQVLVADVSDEASLLAMARSAALLLNCVGPFRYWGEPVVAACVTAGTHYLDICGEPGTLRCLS